MLSIDVGLLILEKFAPLVHSFADLHLFWLNGCLIGALRFSTPIKKPATAGGLFEDGSTTFRLSGCLDHWQEAVVWRCIELGSHL